MEEILNKLYLTANDVCQLMPISYTQALEYIKIVQEEMKEKGYIVPKSKEKLALTKIFRKRFGI